MKPSDERLDALLKQWRDIEPRTDFEGNVWRRVRTNRAEHAERVNLIELIGRWLRQPAMTMAVAVVASVVIGLSAGLLTARRPMAVASSELRFMSAGTLAGGYVKASTEGAR